MPRIVIRPDLASNVPELSAVVDGYPSTSHRLSTSVARAPIETGASVVDHAVAEPPRVVLDGWTSSWSGGGPGFGAAEAWDTIRRLQETVTPVDLYTGWGTYREMLLLRATGEENGLGGRFRIELQQVLRAGIWRGLITESEAPTGPLSGRLSEIVRGRAPLLTVPPLSTGGAVVQQFSAWAQRKLGLDPDRLGALKDLGVAVGVPKVRQIAGLTAAVNAGDYGRAARSILGSPIARRTPAVAKRVARVLSSRLG